MPTPDMIGRSTGSDPEPLSDATLKSLFPPEITHYPEQAYLQDGPFYTRIYNAQALREILKELREIKASLGERPVETALIQGKLLVALFERLDLIPEL